LRGGDEFDQEIRNSIEKCSRFIVVLSQKTVRREAWFMREWKYALDRLPAFRQGARFIVPAVIDETTDFPYLPRPFAERHRVQLPGGKVTEEFLDLLRREHDE
jgi:hypothetical protein